MGKFSYKDYLNLGICPNLDDEGIHFSQENVDFIVEKYLKQSEKFEEYKQNSEARDVIAHNEFDMAYATINYLKNECQHLKEQLKEIRLHNKQHDKFMEINAGLHRECQRYKEREKQFQAQIYALQQKIAEKGKEFELLKHLGSHETTIEMFKENTKLIIETRQFAIYELEKVKTELKHKIFLGKNAKHCYPQRFVSWYEICDQVNQQIKKLKGET